MDTSADQEGIASSQETAEQIGWFLGSSLRENILPAERPYRRRSDLQLNHWKEKNTTSPIATGAVALAEQVSTGYYRELEALAKGEANTEHDEGTIFAAIGRHAARFEIDSFDKALDQVVRSAHGGEPELGQKFAAHKLMVSWLSGVDNDLWTRTEYEFINSTDKEVALAVASLAGPSVMDWSEIGGMLGFITESALAWLDFEDFVAETEHISSVEDGYVLDTTFLRPKGLQFLAQTALSARA